ncbi:hypothetical protein T265_11189 [Opisthorchis viverrini]|uniref:Peptidase C13 family protein n=1 Tax=Opisthorchis viverrini TaxID=6198 RepID=A0A074YZX1_OPIVI|nr:hypothetical protein T265_11189 [Opisthorchis viverrini]KER20203.1 hypothetical protein T265_11189 [Opisthorchis viverrini]
MRLCSPLIAFFLCIDHIAWLDAVSVGNWSSLFHNRPSKNWIVLAAGSNTWRNYRHQDVTRDNFVNVLKGDEKLEANKKKVLKSGRDDNVFIFYSGHGGNSHIGFLEENLYAMELNDTLAYMHSKKKFNKLVLYVEACYSGSMFKDVLPTNMGIYATTSAKEDEKSGAMFCMDPKIDVCLANEYSFIWLVDSEQNDIKKRTLEEQYEAVKRKTVLSNVMKYGEMAMGSLPVGKFHGHFDLLMHRNDGVIAPNAVDRKGPGQAHLILHFRRLMETATEEEHEAAWRRLHRELQRPFLEATQKLNVVPLDLRITCRHNYSSDFFQVSHIVKKTFRDIVVDVTTHHKPTVMGLSKREERMCFQEVFDQFRTHCFTNLQARSSSTMRRLAPIMILEARYSASGLGSQPAKWFSFPGKCWIATGVPSMRGSRNDLCGPESTLGAASCSESWFSLVGSSSIDEPSRFSCNCNVDSGASISSRDQTHQLLQPQLENKRGLHIFDELIRQQLVSRHSVQRRQSAIQQLLQAGKEHGRVRSGWHPGRLEPPHSLLAACGTPMPKLLLRLPSSPSEGLIWPHPGTPPPSPCGGSSGLPANPGRSPARQPREPPQSPPARSKHPNLERIAATGSTSLSRHMKLQVSLTMICRCSLLIGFLFCIDHVAWLEAVGIHIWSSIFSNNPSKNWVVLAAGTNTLENYRHQADVYHAYQVVRKHKVPPENIINFAYDDVANNPKNPFKGKVFHDYEHRDVYNGVVIDYRGKDVTRDNLVNVLKGDKKLEANKKKVLKTGPDDNVFIFYSGHGATFHIAFQEEYVSLVNFDGRLACRTPLEGPRLRWLSPSSRTSSGRIQGRLRPAHGEDLQRRELNPVCLQSGGIHGQIKVLQPGVRAIEALAGTSGYRNTPPGQAYLYYAGWRVRAGGVDSGESSSEKGGNNQRRQIIVNSMGATRSAFDLQQLEHSSHVNSTSPYWLELVRKRQMIRSIHCRK